MAIQIDQCTTGGERRIYSLAQSLAEPVVRRLLTMAQAEASLLTAAIRAARSGTMPHDAADVARYAGHVLQLHMARIETERQLNSRSIQQAIRPLARVGASCSRIRDAAHQGNDGALRPWEVEEIAAVEIWCAENPEDAEPALEGAH